MPTHSTTQCELRIPKCYRKLSAKELRHRAGLAWKRDQEVKARLLEDMASRVGNDYKSGQHGPINEYSGRPYMAIEHHVVVRGFNSGPLMRFR